MADVLRTCLEAGAVGLSTSFVDVDENGRPVPSRFAHSTTAVRSGSGRLSNVPVPLAAWAKASRSAV